MTRSSVRERERIRAAIQTTDPATLAAYAELLRPVVASLRTLTEDATAPPSKRVHGRIFLRENMLKKIRELEARIEAASKSVASAS